MDYPCRWGYKLIGPDRDAIEKAIGEILEGCDFSFEISNTSKTGKYVCLNLELLVSDEEHRTGVYDKLRGHPSVVMVL